MASTSRKRCPSSDDQPQPTQLKTSAETFAIPDEDEMGTSTPTVLTKLEEMTASGSNNTADNFLCNINSGAHGHKYEKDLPLVLFARASIRSTKFKLAVEMVAADKFDDCVFVNLDRNRTMFIQAKHSTSTQPISFKELFELEGKDFDIIKYIKSYYRIEESLKGDNQYFIVTNRKLDRSSKQLSEWMTIEERKVDELLDFTNHGGVYEGLIPHEVKIPIIVEKINSDFKKLKEGIVELFDPSCEAIPTKLSQLKIPLSEIIKKSGKILKFATDSMDRKLYHELAEYFKTESKNITALEKSLVSIKGVDALIKGDSRNKFPVCVDAHQVRQFFEKLTFCTNQPEDFLQVFREDIRLAMRSWVMTNELCKLPEEGTEIPMKRLTGAFDDWYNIIVNQVAGKNNNVPWLTWERGNVVIREIQRDVSETTNKFCRT